jgi:hypothetical protein
MKYYTGLEEYLRTLQDVCSLADAKVTLKFLRTLTGEQMNELELWAGKICLRASDNNVKVPKYPKFLENHLDKYLKGK